MRGEVKYDAPIWETIDESAKDFVKRLIVLDPRQRMTAATAIKHEWITNRELLPDEKPSEEILSKIDNCLLRYKYTSELKKIALNIIAHESSTAEILELRKVFEALDKPGNGTLTFDQFREGLMKCLNYTDSDVEDLFSSIVSA
jgi:calcium-dependent protein kinase